ncbi:carbohydrate ABC transporter permease [Rhizobium laguerreae]|uniref:Carbohydrate ABC transporter membrane protein 2 (CUT1 family) n=1 Tax=Rhizobium laguerreae TaxID=1076926 RepID=A0A1S9GHI8_9HYPH|nr:MULTISPECIES: carbohydrate ABC transporter permease [Rhizobium]MBB3165018.1 multiple sugar transport system permease protein [Rhizobium laguerreae]MBY3067713.1 carbohydrate ABC transporter permease [Rhizobium laguerreae]MBY3081268.1 carbohydrate ABC transporter permease [Rhizobium laguerreae]MBY3083140.1 carbohydrate ABC transporter permease [Rhizobium laguerreae]MBY3115165.1 carbohydrate ABC transporter permease [Rhizobium laguerreae]
MAGVANQRPVAASLITYLVLAFFVILALFPFFYMVSLSLQSDADLFSGVPVIIPSELQFSNYITIWDKAPFARFIVNSFVIAGGITILHLLFDPLIGYVFAKLEFPGRRFMFVALLSTLMLPFFIRMIPLYILTAELGWLNTYQGLIMPFAMSAYGIFMMRQFIRPVPSELLDAARVDGASEWRIYRAIVLPQLGPPMATLGLLTFVFQFNEFLWPLVVVSSVEMRPITTGLTLFNSEFFTQWNLTATGGVILFVPSLLLFVFMQRYFVQSVMMSGMK